MFDFLGERPGLLRARSPSRSRRGDRRSQRNCRRLVPASGVGAGDNCADVAAAAAAFVWRPTIPTPPNSMTQSITAIHAVRSIKLVGPLFTEQRFGNVSSANFLLDRIVSANRPRAESAPSRFKPSQPPEICRVSRRLQKIMRAGGFKSHPEPGPPGPRAKAKCELIKANKSAKNFQAWSR